jgi:hypothetical protein
VPAPFGFTAVDAPVDGSGVVAFDFGVDPAFAARADFPPENGVHEGLRRTAASLTQVAAFLKDGLIINPCEGPCALLDVP